MVRILCSLRHVCSLLWFERFCTFLLFMFSGKFCVEFMLLRIFIFILESSISQRQTKQFNSMNCYFHNKWIIYSNDTKKKVYKQINRQNIIAQLIGAQSSIRFRSFSSIITSEMPYLRKKHKKNNDNKQPFNSATQWNHSVIVITAV